MSLSYVLDTIEIEVTDNYVTVSLEIAALQLRPLYSSFTIQF